jgi:hypothetical protein
MKRLVLFLWIIGIGFGCGVKVRTAYDQEFNFSEAQTFCWLQGCEFTFTGPEYLRDQVSIPSIKEAIIKEMNQKGYVLDEDNADLLVDFHITVESKQTIIRRYDEEYVELDDVFAEDETYYYLEGSFVIDIVDRRSGSMVWRSHVLRHMENKPNMPEGHSEKGVMLALEDFPPEQ